VPAGLLGATARPGWLAHLSPTAHWGRDAAEARRYVEALEFMLACELARFTAGALTWRNAG
jgi:hypothetical protein